ncbi:MAG: bifunctional precorrin-2 dehydrogenase/sirohydrochlorin ferrochelatase [Clostridia bacterium]|nr:bifunctional precorrin-2 dehydrogenase/sirohydrochlorin ferrochelatase [Clostridia bacterium]
MALFPFFIDLKDKKCLVVGGGKVAERKVLALLPFQVEITLLSPKITKTLENHHLQGEIHWICKNYDDEFLKDSFMVIAATSDHEVNARVYRDGTQAGIHVNVVDDPERCSFYFPALVRRDDLVIGISTSGSFPALSKALRKRIGETLPDDLEIKLQVLKELRKKVKSEIHDINSRESVASALLEEAMGLPDGLSKEEIVLKLSKVFEGYKNEKNN